jgi:rhodanese-related sulfurtransferase
MMSTEHRAIRPSVAVLCFAASITVLASASSVGAAPATDATIDIQRATLAQSNQATAEVSTEELRRILAERSAAVFDARPAMEFAVGHIPGAVNVSAKPGQPASLYISDAHEVGRLLNGDRAAPIVLYCNGPFCGKSRRLAEDLQGTGHTTSDATSLAPRSGALSAG